MFPRRGRGLCRLIRPPGTIASLSLWRDMEMFWESRADLFPPETVQGFAQLDTLAGQFFGGREFGADVLGQFDPHWRLVVAQQDLAALKPQPDVKYPAVAIVAELDSADSDFGERFRVAFQAIIGISNVDGNQKKTAALELGSEEVMGVKLATARYMIPGKPGAAPPAPNSRYNFTPATAQVGKYLIFSSSVGLARDLVKELKSRRPEADGHDTAVLEADGPELARLLEFNRNRLAMQLMLDRGETKEKAESQVELGLDLLRYLGHGRLIVQRRPGPDAISVEARSARGDAKGNLSDERHRTAGPGRPVLGLETVRAVGRAALGPGERGPLASPRGLRRLPGRSSSATCATGRRPASTDVLKGEATSADGTPAIDVRIDHRRDGRRARAVGRSRADSGDLALSHDLHASSAARADDAVLAQSFRDVKRQGPESRPHAAPELVAARARAGRLRRAGVGDRQGPGHADLAGFNDQQESQAQ